MAFLRRTAPCLALALLLAAPRAAVSRWIPLGPFGGSVFQLVIDPSDGRVVYAATPQDVFKTLDGGLNWLRIRGFQGYGAPAVAVDPARHGTVYLAGGGKLVKSVDGGASWTPAGPRSEDRITAVAVDPARATRVYAGGPDGMWRSTNRGASWKRIGPVPSGVATLIPVSRPAGTVFAFNGDRAFKSVDAGQAWQPLALPAGVESLGLFAVAPSQPDVLYAVSRNTDLFRSTDGGKSWQAALSRTIGGSALALAVSPRSPRTLWLATSSGLLRSTDGGDTWAASGPQGGRFEAVALSASSPRNLYAGLSAQGSDLGGILASTDSGKTWQRRNHGLAALEVSGFLADPKDSNTLWAHHLGYLYRSTDAGAHWTRMPLPKPQGYDFGSMVHDPGVSSVLYVLDADSYPSHLWRTLNGGATWVDLPHPELDFLRMGPETEPKLWGIGGGGTSLYTSVDGGDHWTLTGQPKMECGALDLAYAPASPKILYAAGERTIPGETACFKYTDAAFSRSTDGGVTWSDLSAGLKLHYKGPAWRVAVDSVNPSLVYLGTTGTYQSSGTGVWKSTDGGVTWAHAGEQQWENVTALVASPVSGIVWTATSSSSFNRQIRRSGDAGATWQDRTENLDGALVYDLLIDPFDSRRIYAATSNGVWVREDAEP